MIKSNYIKFSLVVLLCLWIIGLFFELFFIQKINLSYPRNLILIIILIIVTFLTHIFFRHTFLYKWISSIHNSIVFIGAFIFLCLLMAVIPQNSFGKDLFGLNNLVNTYYFKLTYLFLLINLSFVIVRKIGDRFNLRNVAFLLNHIGFWIVFTFGGLGSYDFIELNLLANYDNPIGYGFTKENKKVDLPFLVELKNFKIEYYLPKLSLVRVEKSNNYKIVKQWDLDTLNVVNYKNFSFRIKKFLPYTFWYYDSLYIVKIPGYVGSAFVEVSNDSIEMKGWISYSSFTQPAKYLQIDEKHFLVLSEALPKDFISTVKITVPDTRDTIITEIKVNKPLNIMKWNIYQKDYNKVLKDLANYTVFEVNYDPWLIIIYIGICMLIAGAILLFITK